MLPRILSFLIPLTVYTALLLTVYGIYHQRKRLDRWTLILAAGAFLLSLIARPNEHLLFFDEDIYIQIASNLSHAPVAQLTLFGSPDNIQASTYYKEPAGFPILLSLVFALTGTNEIVAFIAARALYALAVAAVYLLGKEILKTRAQAVTAAIAFAATPACFAFSASTGTDLSAALFAALGVWGIASGNGMLAAGAFAMAAQIRLEMIALVPLIFVAGNVSVRWKGVQAFLVLPELLHIGYVLSIAPVLAKVEHVNSPFSPAYLLTNLGTNLRYLIDPRTFPIIATVCAMAVVVGRFVGAVQLSAQLRRILILWSAGLFVVYLVFYAGSFDINPRYSIQLTLPAILLAASWSSRPIVLAAIAVSALLPATRGWPLPTYVQALASDHHTAVEFSRKLTANDLVISGEPEIFINQGKNAMNVVFGDEHAGEIAKQLGRFGHLYYYSGVRTNEPGSQQWEVDKKVKSEFELHLIEAREPWGFRIAIYELLKPIHGEGG